MTTLDHVSQKLLDLISDTEVGFSGAYNIRENSGCAGRVSTKNIQIENNEAGNGIDIRIAPGTRGETVYIPALITHSDVQDLVYNDFFIGDNADVTIIAGCGVHTDGEHESSHDGVHRFFVGKNSRVVYLENHIGIGSGQGARKINPVTHVSLDENSYMEMNTSQLEGVTSTVRTTTASVGAGASFIVKEALMTDGNEVVTTDFDVDLDGLDSGSHIVSRSVAKGNSNQTFTMKLTGNEASHGHAECDAIIMDHGVVTALPGLVANHPDAQLIHEAAIGKIAGDQLVKLMTLGLTEEEAEERIIQGFLS